MKGSNELRNILRRIDHRGHPAYKDTAGSYDFGIYILSIDHVQGDPFASPSAVSIHISPERAGFPEYMREERTVRAAVCDRLLRMFAREISVYSGKAGGSGKSGLIRVSHPGQEILERTACEFDRRNGELIFRFEIGFPANGRTICSGELEKILFNFIPECVEKTLIYKNLNRESLEKVVHLSRNQDWIRQELHDRGLVAFIANGSILPRESGVSGKPMRDACPFKSTPDLEVEMAVPHGEPITGMGIPKGVTLIIGGGYHGKSTLLKALERGVYNHIAGDGREYVITDADAVKIRAEDGRSIKNVDISLFIRNLPNKKDTVHFSTEDASGSTSQAAAIVEAVEAGASALLIDEDTSATNFMIRDELMARVVNREMEPICPFIDRVRWLYREKNISTILVAGSCGAYFEKADLVLQMMEYTPRNVTELAKAESRSMGAAERESTESPDNMTDWVNAINTRTFANSARPTDRIKVKTSGMNAVSVDRENIDLRYVEQLVDIEQVSTIGYAVKYAVLHLLNGRQSMTKIVNSIYEQIELGQLGQLPEGRYIFSGLASVRKYELYSALNRFRGMRDTYGERH